MRSLAVPSTQPPRRLAPLVPRRHVTAHVTVPTSVQRAGGHEEVQLLQRHRRLCLLRPPTPRG